MSWSLYWGGRQSRGEQEFDSIASELPTCFIFCEHISGYLLIGLLIFVSAKPRNLEIVSHPRPDNQVPSVNKESNKFIQQWLLHSFKVWIPCNPSNHPFIPQPKSQVNTPQPKISMVQSNKLRTRKSWEQVFLA